MLQFQMGKLTVISSRAAIPGQIRKESLASSTTQFPFSRAMIPGRAR